MGDIHVVILSNAGQRWAGERNEGRETFRDQQTSISGRIMTLTEASITNHQSPGVAIRCLNQRKLIPRVRRSTASIASPP